MPFARVLKLVSLVALLASLSSCWSDSSDPVTRQDCERLRDHLVELRMQSVTVDQEAHRQLLRSSMDESFLTTCAESTSESQLKCALDATDSAALIACDPTPVR